MNPKKLYKFFSGDFPACEGAKCIDSCCKKVQKAGVDIFPDEVLYLLKKYPKKLPVQIFADTNSFTGFTMKSCLLPLDKEGQGDSSACRLNEDRPVFCRCYPVRPERMGGDKFKLFLHENCPQWKKVEDDFFGKASRVWITALKPWNRNIFKKLWVLFCLWRYDRGA